MSDAVHLAIDLGASSGRLLAGRLAGGRLELDILSRFENRPIVAGGVLQWNVLGLWQSILDALSEARRRYPEGVIRSIGVDSWGVDYAVIGVDGQIDGPVRCYRDARNRGAADRLVQRLSHERIFAATGIQFMDINTLSQLSEAVTAGDGNLRRGGRLLLIGDLFHYLMTDRLTVEATNASTTQMLDPRTGDWSAEVCRALDIPNGLLSQPIDPGTTIGPLSDSVRSATGLGEVSVIAPPTHDTAAAVLAVPAVGDRSWCYISSGTWSLMGVEADAPNQSSLAAALNFTNERGYGGTTRLLKNIGGLWVIQQMRASLLADGKSIDWATMAAEAAAASPDVGAIDPDHPSLVAPEDMMAAANELLVDRGGRAPVTRGESFRAALQGLAVRYRLTLAKLERLTGHRIEAVHIVGGGSQNRLLCQMTADACERTVVAGPFEATGVGNVVVQMIADGRIADVAAARQLIADSMEVETYTPVADDRWATLAAGLMTEPFATQRQRVWSKVDARREAKRARAALKDRPQRSAAIQRRLEATLPRGPGATIAWYVDLPGEVETTASIRRALLAGDQRVVVPYSVADRLQLFELRDLDELSAGAFRVREPRAELREDPGRWVTPAELQVVVVPGVAFDRSGNRVGYGRGYYDRLLASIRPACRTIGLAFDCQVFERIDVEPHDRPVTQLIQG